MDWTKLQLSTRQGATQRSQQSVEVVSLTGISIPKQLSKDACITFTHSTATGLGDTPAHYSHCLGVPRASPKGQGSPLEAGASSNWVRGQTATTGMCIDEAGNRVRKRLALLSQTCGLPIAFFLFASTVWTLDPQLLLCWYSLLHRFVIFYLPRKPHILKLLPTIPK